MAEVVATERVAGQASEEKAGPLSIALFYFSGTGSTAIITEQLAGALRERGATVDVVRIEDVTLGRTSVDTSDYDMVGIGYPVHAWNAPRIVYRFVRSLPFARNKKTFTYKCMSDPLATGGSTRMLRDHLWRRGYKVFHEEWYLGGSNFAMRFPDRLTRQLLNAAAVKTRRVAKEIVRGQKSIFVNSLFQRLLTAVSLLEMQAARAMKLHFRVSGACNLCEVCIRDCPTANITKRGSRIAFGWRCTFCMRCIYGCPQRAIRLWLLDWIVVKGYHDVRRVYEDASIAGDFVNERSRGFWKRYQYYLDDANGIF